MGVGFPTGSTRVFGCPNGRSYKWPLWWPRLQGLLVQRLAARLEALLGLQWVVPLGAQSVGRWEVLSEVLSEVMSEVPSGVLLAALRGDLSAVPSEAQSEVPSDASSALQ